MSATVKQVLVSGGFDDVRSRDIRFLQEAARFGDLTLLLWSDDVFLRLTGKAPRFPEAERFYLLQGIRYVKQVKQVSSSEFGVESPEFDAGLLSSANRLGLKPDMWVVREAQDSAEKKAFCQAEGVGYYVLRDEGLRGFPDIPPTPDAGGLAPKKVVVTGCYDWFHSGHVRFFEEVSAFGELHVAVGNDANVRQLKGEGHPLHSQEERRYMVASVRFVKQAMITSGYGWLDAEPEIRRLKPDIYAVNEDGDRGGKREFCDKLGIQYLVLKRTPAPGLPPRTSTELRGF